MTFARAALAWSAPERYDVGAVRTWQGVRLLCTRAHHAGEAAEHPWDPGWGWPPAKAAELWAPDGDTEAVRLRVIVAEMGDPDRLRVIALLGVTG